MNYSQQLIKDYQIKIENIQKNINRSPLFPDRKEPTKYLTFGYEMILKVTFKLRICFLEEMQFLFAFCYSKTKFEKVILELEEMGYIQSEISKDYGKYWCLSQEALHYIYRNSSNPEDTTKVTEDKLPKSDSSKLYFLKIMNGYFSQMVFRSYLDSVWQHYKSQTKEFRNQYSKEQYIKHIVYNKDENSGYSKAQAQKFFEEQLPVLESSIESYQGYKDFLKKIRPKLSDDMVKFSFLKDYFNSLAIGRTKSAENTLLLINNISNNIYRDKYYTFREELYQKTNHSSHIKEDYELFTLSELIHIAKITRKSLLNTNSDNKAENELKELNDKINSLDSFIEAQTPRIDELREEFNFMVFDKYNINDVPMYKEVHISLDTLRDSNVFIIDMSVQDSGKPKISFGIFQTSCEEMTSTFIFTRLEKIFRYYRKNLLSCDYDITIFTYTNQHKELIETKLKTVKEDFNQLTEYAFFLSVFDEMQVVATKNHFQERYKVFEQFKNK